MNREIKFRAWDGNQMYYSNENQTVWMGGLLVSVNTTNGKIVKDFIGMQFTGLHDKNGKDIYEGDVVKKYKQLNQLLRGDYANKGFCYYKVCFEKGKFLLKYISCDDSLKNYFGENKIFGKQNDDLNDCEVIGTIYENPELLKNL